MLSQNLKEPTKSGTNVFMDMANEIYEDENYENNLNSIIEKVFRESGINDTKRIEIAKSTIKVSRSNFK